MLIFFNLQLRIT